MGVDADYDKRRGFYRSFMNVSLGTRLEMGQSLNSLIKSCTFNGRNCLNSEFFGVLSTPEYGNCFTFNSNISSAADREAGQRVASMVGPNTGLSLVLFVDTNNYMPSTVSQTRGARVAIHPSDVTPLMAETGMEVSPTSLTSISIIEVSESHPRPVPHRPVSHQYPSLR
ncbi:amiloride-sensitive sodium channel subunit gamma-2-like [Amphibalanus amphitrite]|uniref:amiloride-sensitive sodium channel subunit gamma-2-like n=1 Tax=Amphibalanus amphitrite TaxID=1232801 RepID=UPI001C921831|nr:amiloride-sensitive sodium channel subunit gamma-2-like [Amphibalanus amphitrite]